jgi:arsenate reductase
VDHVVREFFKEPFTRDELSAILAKAGMKPSELVSTRSSVYRNDQLGGKHFTEDEWLERMLAEPRLIRRPILVRDEGVEVGFSKARYEEIAGGSQA